MFCHILTSCDLELYPICLIFLYHITGSTLFWEFDWCFWISLHVKYSKNPKKIWNYVGFSWSYLILLVLNVALMVPIKYLIILTNSKKYMTYITRRKNYIQIRLIEISLKIGDVLILRSAQFWPVVILFHILTSGDLILYSIILIFFSSSHIVCTCHFEGFNVAGV